MAVHIEGGEGRHDGPRHSRHEGLLDSGGGDGRRRGVGLLSGALVAAASARAAWCAAARWLRRALARGPRGDDGDTQLARKVKKTPWEVQQWFQSKA